MKGKKPLNSRQFICGEAGGMFLWGKAPRVSELPLTTPYKLGAEHRGSHGNSVPPLASCLMYFTFEIRM